MSREITIQRSVFSVIRTYISLTKPGIIMGNIITAAGGFALASRTAFDLSLFLAAMLGIALVVASGCVCNNYIDREYDKKMSRTKNRAFARGAVTSSSALIFAAILGLLGMAILQLYATSLSMWIAAFGFVVYVAWYSFLKHYSKHGTLIGSIAGAVPPLAGYTAASSGLDGGSLILFVIIALWQMPHFYAIAIYRIKEYKAAAIPVLPLVEGLNITKIHMFFYILAFAVATALLAICGYVGYLFLGVSSFLSILWIALSLYGFKADNDVRWARRMFVFSLIVIMGINIVIPFSLI